MQKYRNNKIVVNGITFDSKAEGEFYLFLLALKEKGRIQSIELQEKLILQEKFKKHNKLNREITYTVDFTVINSKGKKFRIDVKGMETQQGNLKRKMYEYKFDDPLIWIAKSKKYSKSGWIEYDTLKRKRRKNKR